MKLEYMLDKGALLAAVMCCMYATVQALNKKLMYTQRHELYVLWYVFLIRIFSVSKYFRFVRLSQQLYNIKENVSKETEVKS